MMKQNNKNKLLHLTDIHLNFVKESDITLLCQQVAKKEPKAIVITGDISESPHLIDHVSFMQMQINSLFPAPIFFVCGNHDYYHGSISSLRQDLSRLFTYKQANKEKLEPRLGWLSSSGVISLNKDTALVGHDGWYDGKYANWFKSDVVLWDYKIIADFALLCCSRIEVYDKINKLAAESARYVYKNILKAFKEHEHVFVATHVPPFRESAVYNGKISDDNYMPHFSSKTMGDALKRAALGNPSKKITVLCGHTHGKVKVKILPNLFCVTAPAEYRKPKIGGVHRI